MVQHKKISSFSKEDMKKVVSNMEKIAHKIIHEEKKVMSDLALR